MSSKKKSSSKSKSNESEKSTPSKNATLPPNIEDKRTRVTYRNDAPQNTSTYDYHGVFNNMGFDNSFSLEDFKNNFKVNVISVSDEEAIFDLVGIDAPLANAFRRIIISEVPTMAIEKVWIVNNTSIIQDEVLSHRMGLIPIKIDPRQFEFKNSKEELETDKNVIIFSLNVSCKANPDAPDDAQPHEKYINSAVYSRDLVWKPAGNQAEIYENIRPVHEDILIAKLRPGQSIELIVHCEKGIGQTHAKWSPVATASYRLMPDISFMQDIKGKEAEEFVKVCPMKVYDIEDLGAGSKRARVAKPRNCTMCRECIRDPKWTDKVKLARVKDHFIFSIESVGALPAATIFSEAVKILIDKCTRLELELQKLAQVQ